MPRTYDDRRWILNEDGSYTRRVPPGKVVQSEGIEVPADGTWSPEITGDGSGEALPPIEENANYYRDITTTGAAADYAAELGIDLSEVEGTGLHGKITKADVEKYAAAH
jgi:2-oxoacid dehydrogenase-like protein with E3 subunit-binding domain